jgi:hypothetical protein
MAQTQTDNHDLQAKLELRRYFLEKYHSNGGINVLDCCQGGGVLWTALRACFAVTAYWGVDLKPKKGRLKIDSSRILEQAGWSQNVIDVDIYGSPWKHWRGIVSNLSRPATVFLTIGQVQIGGSPLIKEVREALELKDLDIPRAISAKLNQYAVSALLTTGYESVRLVEAVEALSHGNARYIGVRLEPIKTNGHGAGTPGRSGQIKSMKEVRHA